MPTKISELKEIDYVDGEPVWTVVTHEGASQKANLSKLATDDSVDAKIDAIDIPEVPDLPDDLATTDDITAAVEGLASEDYVDKKIDEIPAPSGSASPVTFKCKKYLAGSKSSPPLAGEFCIMYAFGDNTSANAWFGNCNHSIKVHYESLFSPEDNEIQSNEEWNLSGYVTVIGDNHKTYLKAPIRQVRRNSDMSYVTIYLSSPVTTWSHSSVDDTTSYIVLIEGYGAS